MNKSAFALGAFFILCGSLIYSCGNNPTMNVVPPGSSAMSVTITDTPPARVSILSFEVSITGATLNPGSIDLLGSRGPVRIEIKQLETESAFLNTVNVPAGTYTSLNLTFANPELTFKNNTGAVLAGCAVGAVCEIKPTGTLTSMVNFPGSGIVLSGAASQGSGDDREHGSAGIQIDVNPNTILSAALGVDFSLSGAVSVQQLVAKNEGEFDDVDDLNGSVQNLSATNLSFTLHSLDGDFAITTGSSTEFEFENCPANNFSCLQNNQVVQVDAKLMPGGTFLAKKIEFEDQAEDDEVEGVVFKVDDATHFEMVVVDELRLVNNVAMGSPIVVTLSNPSFLVDTHGLNVPSGLQDAFQTATDTSQLMTGQVLQIRLASPASAGPPVMATANRVRLRMTQLTATVSGAPVPPNFNLGNLPALFTAAGITGIQVQTSDRTNFDGTSGINGLADGNTVSVRGLLFNNGANPPALIAKKVRKR